VPHESQQQSVELERTGHDRRIPDERHLLIWKSCCSSSRNAPNTHRQSERARPLCPPRTAAVSEHFHQFRCLVTTPNLLYPTICYGHKRSFVACADLLIMNNSLFLRYAVASHQKQTGEKTGATICRQVEKRNGIATRRASHFSASPKTIGPRP
jgi:hypothetical protein